MHNCSWETFDRFKIYATHKSFLACEDKTLSTKSVVKTEPDDSARQVITCACARGTKYWYTKLIKTNWFNHKLWIKRRQPLLGFVHSPCTISQWSMCRREVSVKKLLKAPPLRFGYYQSLDVRVQHKCTCHYTLHFTMQCTEHQTNIWTKKTCRCATRTCSLHIW